MLLVAVGPITKHACSKYLSLFLSIKLLYIETGSCLDILAATTVNECIAL